MARVLLEIDMNGPTRYYAPTKRIHGCYDVKIISITLNSGANQLSARLNVLSQT
jgi:hypothetical protein